MINRGSQERMLLEFVRFKEYFKSPPQHDTKTSENLDHTSDEYKEIIKSKFKISRSKSTIEDLNHKKITAMPTELDENNEENIINA